MVNSETFRVWNVYPLDSEYFLLITACTLAATLTTYFLYHTPFKRTLFGSAAFLALFYLMFVWNLAVNLVPNDDWEVLAAYTIFTSTGLFIGWLGSKRRQPLIRWGGWFYLIFTLVHFLFINIWLVTTPYKFLILGMLGSGILLNQDLWPRYNRK